MAKSSADSSNAELCDAIDEYFRQKFRKISFTDAKEIMCGMGFSKNQLNQPIEFAKIQGLDDKFWVWETLEEASRPQVDEMNEDELKKYFTAWSIQQKGSEELNDLMQERIMFYGGDETIQY